MKKTLYICGYGLNLEQITIESMKIIKEADIVISPTLDKNTTLDFNIKIKSTRNLTPQKQILLIKKLFTKYNKIAFITYGNPCFLNYITYDFKNNLKNVNIRTYPGVSSFDAAINLFNELNLLTNDLVLTVVTKERKSFKLIRDKSTIIFGAEIFNGNQMILKEFTKSFNKTYPPNHKLYIITIKDFFYKETQIIETDIKEFESKIRQKQNMMTLYIPIPQK